MDLCWAQSCSCILPLYACASAVCSSRDVQIPSLQPLAYLRSMIASTLTDACICKLHLYILADCGKQQTRNDRLFIAMRIVCHCLLKTFDANFPVCHDLKYRHVTRAVCLSVCLSCSLCVCVFVSLSQVHREVHACTREITVNN